jgi:hypothetical protein
MNQFKVNYCVAGEPPNYITSFYPQSFVCIPRKGETVVINSVFYQCNSVTYFLDTNEATVWIEKYPKLDKEG